MKNLIKILSAVAMLFAWGGGVCAQDTSTSGTDFWLTLGWNATGLSANPKSAQIRIVSGAQPATCNLYFTETNTSVSFTVAAGQVYTHNLTTTQHAATYHTGAVTITSDKSVHITSSAPVTAYVINQSTRSTDATNLLPITALGTDYFNISYNPYQYTSYADAYAVIATDNNTQVYHDGIFGATLNIGQVYYRSSNTTNGMTGVHITTDKPVAFFACNPGVCIPNGYNASDNLFQQLAPVNTWGKNFFVPVSWKGRDRVRIMVSQNGTTITQTGGTIQYVAGGQSTLANLNAGQWFELEVSLANKGCYIQADKPIGVCAYLTGQDYNSPTNTSDPAQAWVPAIEQSIKSVLIAPFIPTGVTELSAHYALVITPTATKNNTTVKIGTGVGQVLSGGTWYDNAVSGMSFYSMPLTNTIASYLFSNQAGLVIMGYGTGLMESYYYLAGSAMRTLDAVFYVNDTIHYQDLALETVCAQPVEFRAEINGDMSASAGHLKWYIDNEEEISARDQITWNKSLSNGVYQIKMVVLMDDNTTKTAEGVLTVFCPYNTDNINICDGDSVLFGDKYYKEAGIYTDTLTSSLGNDSIVTLDLTIMPNDTTIIYDTVFVGAGYFDNGFSIPPSQTAAGAHSFSLHIKKEADCDSVIILNLEAEYYPDTMYMRDCDLPLLLASFGNTSYFSYDIVQQPILSGASLDTINGDLIYTPPTGNYNIQQDEVIFDIYRKSGIVTVFMFGLKVIIIITPCHIAPMSTESTSSIYCLDDTCRYEGPSILINEVMIAPSKYDGAIYGNYGCSSELIGGEWVELYNPNSCDSVDISGYFMANATTDKISCSSGNVRNLGAAFVLPEGTVISPNGFCVLRGERADVVDSARLVENGGNTVVINLVEHFDLFCLNNSGVRFWLPDAGGWFGFYDRDGIPQDAIYWGAPEQDICADCNPCNPLIAGSYADTLVSLNDIPANRKTFIADFDLTNSTVIGNTPKRIPDGGAWVFNTFEPPTQGFCNSDCIFRTDTICAGTATVTVLRTGNFSYLWNDLKSQTTPTATGLCEGTYCCTVTDTDTEASEVICITVTPDFVEPDIVVIYDTIFVGEGYNENGFTVAVQNTANTVYSDTLRLQNDNPCDSIVVLNLKVNDIPCEISAGNDITICTPATVQLQGQDASNSYLFYEWQPAALVSSPTSLNTSATVSATTIFTLTGFRDSNSNLVVNGDFSAGNVGFLSDYGYSNNLMPEGLYSVVSNANSVHPFFNTVYDHTSGTPSGQFMVVNGSGMSNTVVWQQSVAVVPNTDYVFYTWVTTVLEGSAAQLQFRINGNLLGNVFNAPNFSTDGWQQFYTTWNSGANTVAQISIVNQNISSGGNDFGLDDIYLGEITQCTDTVVVYVEQNLLTTIYDTVCQGENYNLHNFNLTNIQNSTTETQTLSTLSGCDSTVNLYLTVNLPVETIIYDTILVDEDYNKNGFSIPIQTTAGSLVETLHLFSKSGCDSTVTLYLNVMANIQINVIIPMVEICATDLFIEIYYETSSIIDRYSIIFDSKGHQQGFVDIINQNVTNPIVFANPRHSFPDDYLRPDIYNLKIIFYGEDINREFDVTLSVLYPAEIIEQKWNNVLALYNQYFNGGYTFSHYEWYKDNAKIPNENLSYIYTDNTPFDFVSKYRAKLTRTGETMAIFTCEKETKPHYDISVYPTLVDAGYQLQIPSKTRGKITILSVSGILVSKDKLSIGENDIKAPLVPGFYIMLIEHENQEPTTHVLIVK